MRDVAGGCCSRSVLRAAVNARTAVAEVKRWLKGAQEGGRAPVEDRASCVRGRPARGFGGASECRLPL